MRIGEVAKAAAINIETVRFYERKGLIEQPVKPSEGYRDYSNKLLERLLFIRRAKNLGFTLEEIANLLAMESARCDEVQEMATAKLRDVRSKLVDLKRMELVLSKLLISCQTNPKKSGCPIIETLITD
ncbi:MAG TPA: Hg(II)-responsive transcriptional regulator [Leucothrix mucor]|uniref:Mercuric resistance operon regulatory protein n=1 Tax=Leucothrix mucor TaxID=45248 RepID=A0A7V2T0N6_LEUMU|nr:Hg(II)-responsive transcriptional regulator [Leucothrix mucor]